MTIGRLEFSQSVVCPCQVLGHPSYISPLEPFRRHQEGLRLDIGEGIIENPAANLRRHVNLLSYSRIGTKSSILEVLYLRNQVLSGLLSRRSGMNSFPPLYKLGSMCTRKQTRPIEEEYLKRRGELLIKDEFISRKIRRISPPTMGSLVIG